MLACDSRTRLPLDSEAALTRELLLAGIVEFRRAIDAVRSADEWEWGLFTLSEAVRLLPQVGNGRFPPYGTMLGDAVEHVCGLVGAGLNTADPLTSITAQSALRKIAQDLGIPSCESNSEVEVAAFRSLAEETRDTHLRLLCSWACFAHADQPAARDVSLILTALRDTELSRAEATLRSALGRHLLMGTVKRATRAPEVIEAEAIAGIRAHAKLLAPLANYSESLLYVIKGWADNALVAIVRDRVRLAGGGIHNELLAWTEREERETAKKLLSIRKFSANREKGLRHKQNRRAQNRS